MSQQLPPPPQHGRQPSTSLPLELWRGCTKDPTAPVWWTLQMVRNLWGTQELQKCSERVWIPPFILPTPPPRSRWSASQNRSGFGVSVKVVLLLWNFFLDRVGRHWDCPGRWWSPKSLEVNREWVDVALRALLFPSRCSREQQSLHKNSAVAEHLEKT